MTVRRTSYAQNGEDVRAWRALRDVVEPFYVEVGASHPFDDSLTAALSEQGWHGVLVEPEPAAAELLREARPRDFVVAAAAHSRPGLLTWKDLGARGRGSVADEAGTSAERTLSVPAVRLTDVLDDLSPAAVHFLSVDVEGHEEQALRGLDLARWRPWVVCVEATRPGSRDESYESWEPLLLDSAYGFVAFDGLNRWYVAQEHADRAEALVAPFGVLDRMLDGWVPRETVLLQERLDEAVAEVERLRAEHRSDVESSAAAAHRIGELERSSTAQQLQLAEQARTLAALQREVEAVAAQRDAAAARERVMLESKSWRITSPLRGARRNVTNAAAARRAQSGPPPPPPALVREVTAADQRRRRALAAKLAAARSSSSS